MSKHLRFGRLLGLLAVMLTLSFAWAQGQNLSSEKVLGALKFTAADNPTYTGSTAKLFGDVTATINESTRVVTVVLPYRYNNGQPDVIGARTLVAKFKSSDKSNVFKGQLSQADLDITNPGNLRASTTMGQGLGNHANAPYITSGAFPFANGNVLTVEAENHSFVYYTIAMSWADAHTDAAFNFVGATYTKTWGSCAAYTETPAITPVISGNNYTFNVPYGTTLTNFPVTFKIPAYASAYAGATRISYATASGSDNGVETTWTYTLDLTTPKTITVHREPFMTNSSTTGDVTITFTAVVGVPSELDDMLTASYNSAAVAISYVPNSLAIAIPFTANTAALTFTISKYATAWDADPNGVANQICSPYTFTGLTFAYGSTVTRSIWVRGEDPSEVSEYVITFSRNACSSANTLTAISGTWSKSNLCGTAYSNTVVGTIGSSTIDFNVPYGVTSVTIAAPYTHNSIKATGAISPALGATLSQGSTVTVTSECGTPKNYTVNINAGAISDAKEILTYGFKAVDNTGLGFDWNGVNYPGVIDPATKTITVTVPFVTDLHQLKAYFTKSDYSCVFIANTNNYAPQTSNVTPNDHSNRLTYVVRAENNTEDRYEVTVIKTPASSVKTISGFTVTGLTTCVGLGATSYDVDPGNVVVNGNNITVYVKAGTTLTGRSFAFTAGSMLERVAITSGTINKGDFSTSVTGTNSTNPFTIRVTAEDLTYTDYVVTLVARAANSDKMLTAYKFEASKNPSMIGNADAIGVIDQTTRVVTVHVPNQSLVGHLIATFTLNNGTNSFPGGAVMTHSEDLQAIQTSGTSWNDFTTQVAYTIFAEDCSTVEYFVNVIIDANKDNDLLSLSLASLERPECNSCLDPVVVNVNGVITEGTEGNITVQVPYGTDLGHIVLSGAMTPGATANPTLASITSYTVGVPQVVWVTAANGISKKKYTIVVTKAAALTGNALLTFGFETSKNAGLAETRWTATPINNVTYRIDVKVPWGTSLTALKASFTQSPMACVYTNGAVKTTDPAYLQCSGVNANNYTAAVTYTVKSQSGAEAYYNVYVTQDAPLTEKVLSAFSLKNIAYCSGLNISPSTYDIAGTGTTAIAVSVKAGQSLTAVNYAFTVSATATVTATNGTPVKNGTAVTGTANFTTPVTFTVTAQDGSTQAYVVTVTPRAVNSDKKLTKYWLKASPTNPFAGADAVGVINETEKKVEVWVPWGTVTSSLIANFELNNNANSFAGGAVMTHSEDFQYVQTSGVTANDFTTPVAYTVVAEDCSTVEYFVTVRVTPNTDTGISGITFAYDACGCNLSTRIDSYARRIFVSVPSSVNISSLAPTSISITPAIGNKPAASISPAANVAQNWANGPVKYTVTAPDGVTKADWMIYVTNPKCKDTNILGFSLPNAQVAESDLVPGFGKPVVIDTVNHKIDVIIKKGVNLASVYYERTLPCGATVCCVGGNCQDNHYLDFSQGGCHTCVVTAEDQTVTQEWTICVHEIDTQIPEVKTWSVMAYNCSDSVAVQSNELGRVFIVNETAINMNPTPSKCTPLYNLADWTGTGSTSVDALIKAKLGNWATVSAVDTPVYVKTNGLYGGAYWAFSVDKAGRVSCISTERLYLDVCDVTVATLCDLRGLTDVYRYTLSQEVFVSYEETRAGGNWKFVQSADCGILIEDRVNALPASYGVGAGLTNLKGMIDKTSNTVKFIPVCCYTPTKSSTGNVVPVKELTWDEYYSSCYTGKGYESMMVKVTTPMVVFDDYPNPHANWMYDNLDLATTNAKGGYEYFIQSVFNSALIGNAIPTGPAYYQGVRTNVTWSGTVYGLFTPRKTADITLVTAPVISANPNPASIDGVLPGQCVSTTITIYNEGVGNMGITALYLDNAAAEDEFNIVTPPAVPFTLGTWAKQTVTVNFCPLDAGPETTNLIIEYGVGKTLVVPINGTTVLINTTPFCENFNASAWDGGFINGWTSNGTVAGNAIGFAKGGNYGGNSHNGDGYALVLYAFNGYTCNAITPGFNITSASQFLTFYQGKRDYFTMGGTTATAIATDVRKVYISVDGQLTWTEIYTTTMDKIPEVCVAPIQAMQQIVIPMASYVGKTAFFKFAATRTSANRGEWFIDDMCIADLITYPVITINPGTGNFGGVQVGATGTINFAIKNTGVSVLKIKNVSIAGAGFTLTDSNTYPFEVTDGPGTWAYTVGAAGSALNFSVDFKPTDIGVKTGKVTVTYGLYSDQTVEIPLTGEGLSCYTAAVANKGENYAPSQNTWFKYTADKFSIVTVTSCNPHQDLVTNEYAWDTYLYLYSDCTGTLIGSNDDMEGACVYNRASSSVQTVVNGGETIYIFWPLAFPTALHAYEGFYFDINVSYPTDGDVCENAIPLTLPVVNHFGTTVGFNDDYNVSPCSPFSNYMDGNDKVYTITVAEDGYLTGSILGAYGSIHVLDMCPKEELEKFHCKAFVGGPNGGTFTHKKLTAGTYFVIISTWAPPQTVDYLLNLSWESGSAVDNSDLMSTLSVYPNPNSGKFTVSINNPEATDMTIELVNISGQVVYRNEVKAAYSYNEDVDASTFAKGVYYLKVNNGKGVKVEKVVVQ